MLNFKGGLSILNGGAGRNKTAPTQEYRQASARHEQEYAETAAALTEKKELTARETAEVSQHWRKLVKLFHPDRFAHELERVAHAPRVQSFAPSRTTRMR